MLDVVQIQWTVDDGNLNGGIVRRRETKRDCWLLARRVHSLFRFFGARFPLDTGDHGTWGDVPGRAMGLEMKESTKSPRIIQGRIQQKPLIIQSPQKW